MFSSCAVGPDFIKPDAPAVSHYSHELDPTVTTVEGGTAQHFNLGAKITADWWRLFNSPKLDIIITEAIKNNAGLDAAQANLRQSQNNLRSGYGIFYPQLAADAGASRQKSNTLSANSGLPPTIFNLFTLSASVSYALDVFGGQKRLVEGLGAKVDFASAKEQATYLTLSTNIVNTVIAKAAYAAEIESTNQLIELQKEQVKLSEIQEKSGIVPYSNVLSLKSQLATYEATLPTLQQRLVQSDDLLATLAGHTPAEWTSPEVNLSDIKLPENLPVSLPSSLVHQRPDIIAAEATLHAASAGIGVATAALLPSFSLNGSYGTNSTATNSLFAAQGNFWSLGAGATSPIFEGGTLWFKRKAAIDNYKQASALYRQTVLSAFAQVADTLHALDHDAATLTADDEALSNAQQALSLLQANYKAGLVTYLDVLNADVQYHQAKINDLQAIAVRYQDSVALFASLGGGWWNAD